MRLNMKGLGCVVIGTIALSFAVGCEEKSASNKVTDAAKDAANKSGEAVKDAANKTAEATKDAANKTSGGANTGG